MRLFEISHFCWIIHTKRKSFSPVYDHSENNGYINKYFVQSER